MTIDLLENSFHMFIKNFSELVALMGKTVLIPDRLGQLLGALNLVCQGLDLCGQLC
ncbi:hypothetical protein D3C76_1829430 [compost metagenome]